MLRHERGDGRTRPKTKTDEQIPNTRIRKPDDPKRPPTQ
jgi:hypothetical protein